MGVSAWPFSCLLKMACAKTDNEIMPYVQRLQPFEQGRLEGFCGPYCIVNAVHLVCGPLTRRRATQLLQDILRFLDQRVGVVERVDWGFTLGELGGAMRHVLDGHYPIRRCKPFHGRPQVGLDAYWATVQTFIQRHDGAVITAIGGRLDHWTVIRDVTDHQLLLFDSDGRVRVARRYCAMAADAPERTPLRPVSDTHLLSLGRSGLAPRTGPAACLACFR